MWTIKVRIHSFRISVNEPFEFQKVSKKNNQSVLKDNHIDHSALLAELTVDKFAMKNKKKNKKISIQCCNLRKYDI